MILAVQVNILGLSFSSDVKIIHFNINLDIDEIYDIPTGVPSMNTPGAHPVLFNSVSSSDWIHHNQIMGDKMINDRLKTNDH